MARRRRPLGPADCARCRLRARADRLEGDRPLFYRAHHPMESREHRRHGRARTGLGIALGVVVAVMRLSPHAGGAALSGSTARVTKSSAIGW